MTRKVMHNSYTCPPTKHPVIFFDFHVDYIPIRNRLMKLFQDMAVDGTSYFPLVMVCSSGKHSLCLALDREDSAKPRALRMKWASVIYRLTQTPARKRKREYLKR